MRDSEYDANEALAANIIPLRASPAALQKVTAAAYARTYDPDDWLTEQCQERAAKSFDNASDAVMQWLREDKQFADVFAIATAHICPSDDSGYETICAVERLRDRWIEQKAEDYVDDVINDAREEGE